MTVVRHLLESLTPGKTVKHCVLWHGNVEIHSQGRRSFAKDVRKSLNSPAGTSACHCWCIKDLHMAWLAAHDTKIDLWCQNQARPMASRNSAVCWSERQMARGVCSARRPGEKGFWSGAVRLTPFGLEREPVPKMCTGNDSKRCPHEEAPVTDISGCVRRATLRRSYGTRHAHRMVIARAGVRSF